MKHTKVVDFLLQIIDMGVLFHPGAYMRDLWNILDATVVLFALIAIAYSRLV